MSCLAVPAPMHFNSAHAAASPRRPLRRCWGGATATARRTVANHTRSDAARLQARRLADNAPLIAELQADLRRLADTHRPETCVICHVRLQPTRSRLLPCLHAVCADCAAQPHAADAPLRCPLCDIAVPPDAGPLTTPHPLVEALVARPEPCRRCTPTALNATATHHCEDCGAEGYMCGAHAQLHARDPDTAHHRVVNLIDATAGTFLTCAEHSRNKEVYCVTDRQVICTVCALTNHTHPEHDARLLAPVFCNPVRGRVVDIHARGKWAAAVRSDRALDALITVRGIAERTARLEAEINARVDALHALLDARRRQLLEQLAQAARTETEAVQDTGMAERVAYALLTSQITLANQLPSTPATPDAVLVQLEPNLYDRLHTLVRTLPEAPVPQPRNVTFAIADAVEETIRTLGDFVVAD